jgi:hypothetical protein
MTSNSSGISNLRNDSRTVAAYNSPEPEWLRVTTGDRWHWFIATG